MSRTVRFAIVLGSLLVWQTAAAAEPAATDAWQKLEPPDEGFRIELPGRPEAQTGEVETPAGKIHVRHYLLTDEPRRRIYSVTINRLPQPPVATEVDVVIDRARDGALQQSGGKLLDEQTIRLGNIPGRALLVQAPGGLFVHARLFVADDRLYQFGIISDAREPSADDRRTFDSATIHPDAKIDLTPRIDWRFVTPRDEKLAIEMPDDPRESTAALDTPLGRVKLTRLECTIAGRLYFVQICDLPAAGGGDDGARLDAARDHALQALGGKTIEETPLAAGGRSGRTATIAVGDGRTLRLRTVVDGTRVYQLGTLGPDATATPDQLRFLNSLKLPAIAPQ